MIKQEKLIFCRSNSGSKPTTPVVSNTPFFTMDSIFDRVSFEPSDPFFFKNSSEMFGVKEPTVQEEQPFIYVWPQAPYNDNAYLMEYHANDAPTQEEYFENGMPIDLHCHGSNFTNIHSVGSKGLSRSELKELISLDFKQPK